jgi:uncharacterized metal-binding protein
MEKFSTAVLAKFIGIAFCIIAILFCWLTMTVLTSNLLVGTLKPLFFENIKALFDNPITALQTTFGIIVPFACMASFSFEGSAFWFRLRNRKDKSIAFSILSGILSTAGMLSKIQWSYVEPFKFGCDLLVYFIIGFMFPVLVYNLTEVLYDMLNEKTENGMTILEIMKVAFQKEILAILKNEKVEKPKENRFDVLLGGLAPEENEIKQTDFDNRLETYKQKYNANN